MLTVYSCSLLQGNGSACAFQSFLGSIGSSLVDAFQNRLWSTIDQVFCIFQTQGSQCTYFFNNTDLGIACGFENNVEFGLLFSFTSVFAATCWGSSHCDWSSSGYVEFFFESLDEFGQF